MAWSRLQSASHAALGLTNPVTMGSNCSSGSTLIAVVAQSGTTSDTVSSVKDGAGNSFIFLASAVLAGSAGTRGLSIWALNTPAGDVGIAPTITATVSTSTDSAILVQEISGIVTGSTLAALVDGTPGALSGTAMGATGSPSYTSTAANEYLVAVYGDDGDGTTYTKPAALTDDLNSINSSSLNDIAIAYGNSTNGVEAGSWSLASGTSAHWGVLLLAFQVTAGAAAATYTPQRYGQPAPAWPPQQRQYVSDPSFYPPFTVPPTPLDTAWQANAQYSHLYSDDALRDRRQYFTQLPRVSDPNLLIPPVNLDPTTAAAADTTRRVHTASYWDRRLVPQQKDMRDANTVGVPGPVTDQTTNAYQDRQRRAMLAATHVDRRLVPQQRTYPDRQPDGSYVTGSSYVTGAWWSSDDQGWNLQRAYYDTTLLATAQLENELLGGAGTAMRYLTAAYWDRRQVPQQRTYVDLTSFAYSDVQVGAGTTEAWWGQDTSPFYPAQRLYISDPSAYPPVNPLDPLLAGQDLLDAHQHQAATHYDRRLVPQQRVYISDPSFYPSGAVTDPLTLAWGAGGNYWHLYNRASDITDRRFVPQQRSYVSDPLLLTTALLENELLGGEETGKYYRTAASHALRWWMPQQPARLADPLLITTALLENELLGGADTIRHYLAAAYWDRRLVPQQRLLASDPNLLAPAVPLDPTQSAWLPLWLAYNTAATNADRREVPQQRLYISDPSFYPTIAPTDPLTLAWGAGGTYWHMYNQAADVTDRRLVPQQRAYVSDPLLLGTALLENELLGGAETGKYYRTAATHYDRREVPQQRAYYDISLLATALLENELLGSAEMFKHGLWQRPGSWPQQRAYISDPSFYPSSAPTDPLTLAWGAGGPYWHLYNRAGDITDRRLVPQQRPYVSDPLLLTTAELENELLGGAETPKYYRTPASHYARWWMPEQRAYVSDPLLLGTAQLENELLGGAETGKNYRTPATHYDRREVPAQRQYFPLPPVFLDPLQSAWASLWLAYNTPATHTDRRLYPQQRLYFPVPLPPPPIQRGEAAVTLTDPYGAAASVREATAATVSVS